MTYSTDIDALNPVARYPLDADAVDVIAALNGTQSGGTFTGDALCLETTNSYLTAAIADRITLPTSPLIDSVDQPRKAVGGWFSPTGIQNPPKSIYGEGGTANSIRFILGWGNNLVFEVNSLGNYVLQAFGDVPLDVNRSYHMFMVFEGSAFGNEFRAYLDGVEQVNAEPLDRQPNHTVLPARNPGEFGAPAAAVAVGGTEVVLLAPINGQYNQWALFDGADAVLTTTQIREQLFEKGAIPESIITTDTEAAMQADLDTYASNAFANSPLCLQIEAVTP